jgi:hypothetical protein
VQREEEQNEHLSLLRKGGKFRQQQTTHHQQDSRFATKMTDPNGWVKNPPSVFVKVHGTSREEVNGKFGLVLQYSPSNSRYTLLLIESSPQSQVSLKVDHLRLCSGMVERAQAYYHLFRNNSDIARQVQQVSSVVQSKTGLSLSKVGILVLVALVLGVYFLGFSRVLLLLTIILVVLTVIGPDLVAGSGAVDYRTIARNAPGRWREIVRQQIPGGFGDTIANKPLYLNAFTAALVAFALYSLLATSSSSSSASRAAAARKRAPLPPVATLEMKQHYYKLGFDDATNAKDFGTSLATLRASTDDAPYDWASADAAASRSSADYEDYKNMSPLPSSPKKSFLNLSTMFSMFTIGQTIYPLVLQAGGPNSFNPQVFLAGLQGLDTWKMGVLGFSVYRLVSAILF